jgi:hypothetical protein
MQRNAEKIEKVRAGASFATPLRTSASPRLCVKLPPLYKQSLSLIWTRPAQYH